jgi:hypothetical protein
MPLPRLHLFELEDQPWFPDLLRRGTTDYLAAIAARTKPYAAVLPAIAKMLEERRGTRIRDYCSGAGGPWPRLLAAVSTTVPGVRLELSDAYPNADALTHFPAGTPVTYRDTPLSPTDLWPAGATLVTMFAAFHHFPPGDAQQILRRANESQTPIAIFEVTQRSVRALVLMCIVPIAVLLLTPAIRPFRWWRLLFTYLIPIIPIAVWWDGIVSCLRTYRPDEMMALAEGTPETEMAWQAGEWNTPGQPLPVTYLIGTPTGDVATNVSA